MTTAICLGTRPEIIKLWSFIKILKRKKESFFIIHTGQHYSTNMSESFFKELNLPEPKYNLGVNGGTDISQISRMIDKLGNVLAKESDVDTFVVQGDTNSVLAGVLVAKKLSIKRIVHIEAGLRSRDLIPEEINRVIADHCGNYLFCPTQGNYDNLIFKCKNGNYEDRVYHRYAYVVGNTLIDLLNHAQNRLMLPKTRRDYILMTLHRQNNVDSKANLSIIMQQATILAHSLDLKVRFLCHPRTKKRLDEFGIVLSPVIKFEEPCGFVDFLTLEKNARLIISDSGGCIEESNFFKVPCVVIRSKIEREEALVENAILVNRRQDLIKKTKELLARNPKKWTGKVFGEGGSAEKIYKILYESRFTK